MHYPFGGKFEKSFFKNKITNSFNHLNLGGQNHHHDYIRMGWLSVLVCAQPLDVSSFDKALANTSLGTFGRVVTNNLLPKLAVVAFGGGWNCQNTHAI